ncbi:MAG: peptidoglycan synthetase [Bacteroidota bacterium]|nr:peptidoglycan synthetase [Bacteroidota bacterium]
MRIHFIAIGGSVMHQLAIALKRKGYEVSGSDDEIFEPAASNLQREGLHPGTLGWFPEKIGGDLDAVILGMHAKQDNPELVKARSLGFQIYSFPEYIFRESETKKRVAIGGSHGKTTTTAMVMHVLRHCRMHFDYLVGARLEGFDQSVQITDAPVIVCEADEYPASTLEKRPKFHFLYPHIAVITGIAWDHINVFPTFQNYLEQFVIFMDKIEKGGVLIYNARDEHLKSLIADHKRPDIRYIGYALPKYTVKEGRTHVEIGQQEIALRVFGDHNLLNMQASYYVCKELGVGDEDFARGIASFSGASKRLELLGEKEGGLYFRDFAHAPSKVKASLEAVRNQYPDRGLVAVLELHTFSSLNREFMKEYKGAMDAADSALIFYSSHALELKRLPPLDPEIVREGFQKPGLEIYTRRADLEKRLSELPQSRTNYLFMSSGNYEGLDIARVCGL